MLKLLEKYLILIVIILFAIGILLHLQEACIPFTQKITDVYLFGNNTLIFTFFYLKYKDKRLLIWFMLAILLTFAIEVVGIRTGLIFGHYAYGNTLWIQWLGVPVVIGQNWAVLILGSYLLVNRFISNNWLVIFVSSLFVVFFDFSLEPVAIKLNYWYWENNSIPLQNYVAWFIIAFLLALWLDKMEIEYKDKVLPLYFLIQLSFFLILRFTL